MKEALRIMIVGCCLVSLSAPPITAQSRRDRRDRPEKLLDHAGVKPGMVIGEAGAGSGFLTFFLSRRVGEAGHVYANDIDAGSLRRLPERCEREGVDNITTILGEVDDPLFPVNDLDLVTMIYAFHDFTEKVAWLRNVKKYMKPDAPIFIFDGQDSHTGLNRETAERIAAEAGFRLANHAHLHGGLWVYELRRGPSEEGRGYTHESDSRTVRCWSISHR